MSFLLMCKPTTHKWLRETVENSFLEEEVKESVVKGKWMRYIYRYINGVPIKYEEKDEKNFLVNYVEFEIKGTKTGKTTYKSSWITNLQINENNFGTNRRVRSDTLENRKHAHIMF
ncbi:MAG: hypothetical protein Ta2B_28810 [Termitinemataceae bacterium]|nr:MAG: hypothetical protein Ta2B_28810 [Termitinemataceae bacterium]